MRRLPRTGDRAYVIAEAGVNHEGDLARAHELIRAAAGTGIDAVKFQTYKADRLVVRRSPAYWDTTQEPTATQHELFSKYDQFGPDEYAELARACEAAGLHFLSTPFDVELVDWLDELVPMWKIASGDITNVRLLRRVARTGKPILLSTGASTIAEIDQAVAWLREAGADEIALLHCTLAYPTADQDANVAAIAHLRRAFPEAAMGYSDHTLPASSAAAIEAAYVLGARVIEKHYTHDGTLPGNDHYHAFEPAAFAELVARLDALRTLLGDGEKRVLAVEEPARVGARRSLVSRVPIAAGTALTGDLLDVKRPGNGVPPALLDDLEGWVAACDVPADTTLEWEMIVRERPAPDARA